MDREKISTKSKIINAGVAVIAMVVIICIGVTVTVLARPLYYFDIEHLDIAESSGVSEAACKLNYDVLIDYNLLGGSHELVFPTLPQSEQGRIHFQEVKEIFIFMQIVAIAGLAIFLVWGIWWIKKSKGYSKKKPGKGQTLWMRLTGIVTAGAVFVVALAMAIDWQWAFETMHGLFFDNDYWLFDPRTDPVITILPDEFFFHCGIMIVIIALVQILALEWGYRKINRRDENE